MNLKNLPWAEIEQFGLPKVRGAPSKGSKFKIQDVTCYAA